MSDLVVTTLSAIDITANSVKLRGKIEEVAPSWPDANGYIYNEGQYEDMWVPGYTDGAVLSKETDHLLISITKNATDSGTWVTDQKIDLTNYNTLELCADLMPVEINNAQLIVSTEKMADYSVYDVTSTISWMSWRTTADISSLEGEFYIRIYFMETGSGAKLKIYSVQLLT